MKSDSETCCKNMSNDLRKSSEYAEKLSKNDMILSVSIKEDKSVHAE